MSSNWRQDTKKKTGYGWRGGQNQSAHKSRYGGSSLDAGMKGFICTFNDKTHKKDCIRDVYNILNEFAEECNEQEESPEMNQSDGDKDGGDVDASLEAELAALKQSSTPALRRFQAIGCDVNNVIFIKTTIDNPCELAHKIVSSIASSKVQRSKLIMRFIPVQVTCKANLDDILKTTNSLLPQYFSEGGKSFAILFSHKYNTTVSRDKVIEELAGSVLAMNNTNKVDLSAPDLSIMVDVMRKVCCIAVIPDYFKLKKYNIMELCIDKDEEAKKSANIENEDGGVGQIDNENTKDARITDEGSVPAGADEEAND